MKTRKQIKQKRKTIKQKQKHKGGKYVGEGSYGCGFAPDLLCKGETERKGLFSKLMKVSEAEDEWNRTRILEKIDPDNKYFLYPIWECEPDTSKFDPHENNIEKCGIIYRNGKQLINILDTDAIILKYPFGGTNLSNIKLTSFDYQPFFTNIFHLFQGLKVLHDNNHVHLDIKEGNIVTNNNNFNYIDFGFMTNIYDYNLPPISAESNYIIWPFDIKFLIETLSPYNYVRYIDRFYRTIVESRYFEDYPLESYIDPDTRDFKYTAGDFINFYNRLRRQYSNITQFRETILKGVDVYSLGLVLSSLYTKNIKHSMINNEIYVSIKNEKILVDHLKNVSQENYNWQNAVALHISIPFYKLIKEMLELNPIKRITITNALKQYELLLPKIAVLFTNENISKYILE